MSKSSQTKYNSDKSIHEFFVKGRRIKYGIGEEGIFVRWMKGHVTVVITPGLGNDRGLINVTANDLFENNGFSEFTTVEGDNR